MGIQEDPQVKMNNAEVMTVALSASLFFSGNYEKSREFLSEHGYIANMISKSRFNRRLLAIPEIVWLALFNLLAELFKQTNEEDEYVMDSFPVPVCDNIRISPVKSMKAKNTGVTYQARDITSMVLEFISSSLRP